MDGVCRKGQGNGYNPAPVWRGGVSGNGYQFLFMNTCSPRAGEEAHERSKCPLELGGVPKELAHRDETLHRSVPQERKRSIGKDAVVYGHQKHRRLTAQIHPTSKSLFYFGARADQRSAGESTATPVSLAGGWKRSVRPMECQRRGTAPAHGTKDLVKILVFADSSRIRFIS